MNVKAEVNERYCSSSVHHPWDEGILSVPGGRKNTHTTVPVPAGQTAQHSASRSPSQEWYYK